jgi:hypothetical protein
MLPQIQDAVVYYLVQSGIPVGMVKGMVEDRPPADAGTEFISVYPTGWNPGPDGDMQEAIDEIFSIGVCLSYRSAYAPEDREFDEVWRKISSRARQIMRAIIPNRWLIMQRVNRSLNVGQATQIDIADPNQYLFYETLTWQGNDAAPVPRLSDWWHADMMEEDAERHQGYSFNLSFSGMRLSQPISSMEL